jgi:hypothetical protein
MNADKMLENEGYVFSDTTIASNKKTVVSYINNQKWNRIAFMLEDKAWIAESFLHSTTALDAQVTKAVLKKCEEMGWLESEQSQETNFEHYKDEIRDAKFCFAIRNGEVVPCGCCSCRECLFFGNHTSCSILRTEWLYQKYQRKYKLSRFEYDLIKTFDRCKECCLLNEVESLKKLREKGYFNGINPFTKIHDIIDNCEVAKDER